MNAIDSTYPFSGFVNRMIPYLQATPLPALANQAQQAAAGDPLWGTTIPKTKILWQDATQIQQFIAVWYGEAGQVVPDDMQKILDINAGPDAPWNWSYTQWGIVKGDSR